MGSGCQDLACRNDYICGGFKCDPDTVLCKTSCKTDADCAQGLGYKCQDSACVCDTSNEKAYCRKGCRVDADCANVPGCEGSGDTFSGAGSGCSCKDPCYELLDSCLAPDAGQTPIGAPKQCIPLVSDTTDPTGTDDAGDTWDTGTPDAAAETMPDEDWSWNFDDDTAASSDDAPDAGVDDDGVDDDVGVADEPDAGAPDEPQADDVSD